MHSRGIMLLLLAALLAGNALGDVTAIPATQDVYISMGEINVSVYNQTDILLCAVNATGNRTEMISYPGAPIIQFDISGLNFTDNDVAVLVLKAACIQKQADPIMVALMSIGSDWNESSDYNTFLVNILSAWDIFKMNDAAAMSCNTDGDSIFAFDVSQKLRDAREEGDKISFLLEAISNNSSEISFRSRESGEGPCLVVMPYPVSTPDVTMLPDLTLNSSLQPDQAPKLPENVSMTGLQTNLTTNSQADLAGAEIPAVGSLQSNLTADEKLALPIK